MALCDWLKRNDVQPPDDDTTEPTPKSDLTKTEPAPKPVIELTPSPMKPGDWEHLDSKKVVPAVPLQKALVYYDAHPKLFTNTGYITILDFTQHSSKLRMYIIGLQTGNVWRHAFAHGKNSDVDNDGYATDFSNVNGSLKSCLGMIKTGGTYIGSHGRSLLLHGLEKTNDNMLDRSIVLHGSDYVSDGRKAGVPQGRSWGCPAVQMSLKDKIIDQLEGGSLMYAWHAKYSA